MLGSRVPGMWRTCELAGDAHFRSLLTAPLPDDGPRLGRHSAISATLGTRDPALAFLYQQLNTFHSPPMGAVGRAKGVVHIDIRIACKHAGKGFVVPEFRRGKP